MSTVAFDNYAQVKQLVQTGVPEAQAEAIINAVAGATALPDVSKLATKDDLEKLAIELRGEMNGLRGETNGLRGEMNGLKGEMNGLRGEMNGLKGEMKGLKGELIWWILGAVGASAVLPRLPEIVARLHL